MKPALSALALLALLPSSSAQSNAVPGIDTRLSRLADITSLGHVGVFPDGINGASMATTVCNDGTLEVAWHAAMNPAHPKIAFLVARLGPERLEQISDRSYVKHGFFAANTVGCGVQCQQPTGGMIGEALGIGCSDTYAIDNNGDQFWLAPPDEIDPWLGTWDPVCSHFDRGEPDVGAPANCNGLRSLSRPQVSALGPVGHRIRIHDEDLILGGRFFFQGQYVVEGEPENVRENNLGSREFTASWDGSRWDLDVTMDGVIHGSVLERWSGAELASAVNGGEDGRVYAAVKITGPVDGFYHYEYALHDRDNARGVGALRIPLCSGARVRATGFHDVDGDPSSDWDVAVGANEIVFSTDHAPLRWNTLFNFWFDSDAAPAAALLALDAFDAGQGASALTVQLSAPVALANVYLGAGCAQDTPPTLFATGTPARAELGNATFALVSAGNEAFQAHVLRLSLASGSVSIHGCTSWIGGAGVRGSLVVSDGAGVATHPVPIPSDPALEGVDARFQAVGHAPGSGILFGAFELSDALLVRIGSSIPSCP